MYVCTVCMCSNQILTEIMLNKMRPEYQSTLSTRAPLLLTRDRSINQTLLNNASSKVGQFYYISCMYVCMYVDVQIFVIYWLFRKQKENEIAISRQHRSGTPTYIHTYI